MRRAVITGGIGGLVLGGLVIFGLAREPAPAPVNTDLAPLSWSDSGDGEHGTSVTPGHRPVRPGSQRVYDATATRS